MIPSAATPLGDIFSNRPKQFTDNELNCGGFSAQWDKHGGKCGVCGDEYNIANPKYIYPGLFAQDGFITKTYKEGETIQVTIKITSNNQGFFRFTVGKLERRPITQEQLTHVFLQLDRSNTSQLHSSANGRYHIKLVLPKGLTRITACFSGGGQWETTGAAMKKEIVELVWERHKKHLSTVQISR